MIIRGVPAIIAYSVRSRIDNSYVNTTYAPHAVSAYGYTYTPNGQQVLTSTELTHQNYESSQTGIQLLKIEDTDYDCIIITGTSNDDTYIGPIVIYPIDLGAIATAVSGGDANAIANAVWSANPSTYSSIQNDTDTMGHYIQGIVSGVWDATANSYTTTGTMGAVVNDMKVSETTKDGHTLITTSNIATYMPSVEVDTTSITNAINDVPQNVWTYAGYSTAKNGAPIKAIADQVWDRSQNATNRQLTSNVLAANGSPELLLKGDLTLDSSGNTTLSFPTAVEIANEVWSDSSGRTRTLTSSSSASFSISTYDISQIASSVWSHCDRTLTSNGLSGNASLALSGSVSGSSGSSPSAEVIAATVWTYTNRSINNTSVGGGHSLATSDTFNTLNTAITQMPESVWTYNGDYQLRTGTPVARIADKVWGRDPSSTARQLTSETLDKDGTEVKLAVSGEVATPQTVWNYGTRTLTNNTLTGNKQLALSNEVQVVINNESIQATIPTVSQIAAGVWGNDVRTLTSSSGDAVEVATSADVTSITNDISGVPPKVWSSAARTLTAATLSEGSLATTDDIPEAPDVSALESITATLEKVFGVLCHWKIQGDTITVYKDNDEVLFTIPTVKDKYGDIVKMGSIPEEQP